jgi:hypothetical protein
MDVPRGETRERAAALVLELIPGRDGPVLAPRSGGGNRALAAGSSHPPRSRTHPDASACRRTRAHRTSARPAFAANSGSRRYIKHCCCHGLIASSCSHRQIVDADASVTASSITSRYSSVRETDPRAARTGRRLVDRGDLLRGENDADDPRAVDPLAHPAAAQQTVFATGPPDPTRYQASLRSQYPRSSSRFWLPDDGVAQRLAGPSRYPTLLPAQRNAIAAALRAVMKSDALPPAAHLSQRQRTELVGHFIPRVRTVACWVCGGFRWHTGGVPRRAKKEANGPEPLAMLRSEHVEATRRAVLASARSLFGGDGYAQTSLDEIAAAARVTKGAVYHHFASKKALFRLERLPDRRPGAGSARRPALGGRGGQGPRSGLGPVRRADENRALEARGWDQRRPTRSPCALRAHGRREGLRRNSRADPRSLRARRRGLLR